MLMAIPFVGLVIGLYAALTFGRDKMLVLWLGGVASIVAVHTYFWRDMYFSGTFFSDATASLVAASQEAQLSHVLLEAAERAQLGIATAFLLVVGIFLSTVFSKTKAEA